MSSWRLYDVTGAAYYDMSDGSVQKQLAGLNVCKDITIFSAGLPDDREVKIYDPDDNIIFHGFTKRKTSESNSTIEIYSIYQRAHELLNDMVSDGDYEVTYTSDNVNTIVDAILSGTGWTRGSSDTTVIDYASFTYRKKLTALYDILRDQRGHNIWFNDTTKVVYFGVNNTDRTGIPITYINKTTKLDTDRRNVTKVVVIGNTIGIVGSAGSGTPVIAYRYDNLMNNSEASRIATQLLSILGSTKQQITVELDSIDTFYEEGDLVKVDTVNYTVFNVKIKMDSIVLTLDAGILNVNDLFDGRLHEVSGSVEIGENSVSSYDGGEQNVGSTVFARYRVQVDDINLVNSFKLVGKLGKWKKALATGLEGTGLGVDSDNALINETPESTGLTIDDENLIPRTMPSSLSSTSNSSFNFSSQFTPSSGWSDHAWSLAHGSINVFSSQDDSIFYVQIHYWDGAWRLACQSAYTRLMNGQRCTVDVTGLAPGSTLTGGRLWKISATQSGAGNLTVDAYELGITFMGLHNHDPLESNHDHSVLDAGHDHSVSETDHDHPETNNLTEIDNFPANVVIKVNSTTVGTWNSAVNGQIVTVTDIKAQLITGLNEITVESTKAISIYLGGEVNMVLL